MGEEAQKGNNRNKNRGKGVYRGICYTKKRVCVCTTLLPLFQDKYPNCEPQGTPQVLQDKHPPSVRLGYECAMVCDRIVWEYLRSVLLLRQVPWNALAFTPSQNAP